MSDKSVMSARQSAELDHALERNGWTAEDVKWLSQGKLLADILKIRYGLAEIKIFCPFTVWKTIKLGAPNRNALHLRNALSIGGFRIEGLANELIGKIDFLLSNSNLVVDLVNVSVADLGFKDGATRADIYNRAKKLGLDLCPAEVGPWLRLQYADQPMNEWLLVAMEPIAGSDSNLRVFSVLLGADGSLWLSSDGGCANNFLHGNNRLVFWRRE